MTLRGFATTVAILMVATGCAASSISDETPTIGGSSTSTGSTNEAPPTSSGQSAEPQRVEFESDDGTDLVGTFWPAPNAQQQVAGVLLLHWNPGTRNDWNTLAVLLQGMAISNPSPDVSGYAVFAFDFRGHGESGGSGEDRAGYVNDAQVALQLFRTLPGVDENRIVMIGASIGADAAVDVCGEGCIGVVSLSPGNFTGINFEDAVTAMGDKAVLCVASEGDDGSPKACRDGEAGAKGDYQVQIYKGSAHAMQMFDITEEEPALTDFIFQWLHAHAPLTTN